MAENKPKSLRARLAAWSVMAAVIFPSVGVTKAFADDASAPNGSSTASKSVTPTQTNWFEKQLNGVGHFIIHPFGLGEKKAEPVVLTAPIPLEPIAATSQVLEDPSAPKIPAEPTYSQKQVNDLLRLVTGVPASATVQDLSGAPETLIRDEVDNVLNSATPANSHATGHHDGAHKEHSYQNNNGKSQPHAGASADKKGVTSTSTHDNKTGKAAKPQQVGNNDHTGGKTSSTAVPQTVAKAPKNDTNAEKPNAHGNASGTPNDLRAIEARANKALAWLAGGLVLITLGIAKLYATLRKGQTPVTRTPPAPPSMGSAPAAPPAAPLAMSKEEAMAMGVEVARPVEITGEEAALTDALIQFVQSPEQTKKFAQFQDEQRIKTQEAIQKQLAAITQPATEIDAVAAFVNSAAQTMAPSDFVKRRRQVIGFLQTALEVPNGKLSSAFTYDRPYNPWSDADFSVKTVAEGGYPGKDAFTVKADGGVSMSKNVMTSTEILDIEALKAATQTAALLNNGKLELTGVSPEVAEQVKAIILEMLKDPNQLTDADKKPFEKLTFTANGVELINVDNAMSVANVVAPSVPQWQSGLSGTVSVSADVAASAATPLAQAPVTVTPNLGNLKAEQAQVPAAATESAEPKRMSGAAMVKRATHNAPTMRQ